MLPLLRKLYKRVFKLTVCDDEFEQRAFDYVTAAPGYDIFGIKGGDWTTKSLSRNIPVRATWIDRLCHLTRLLSRIGS